MHSSCWQNYFDDVQTNERQRSRMRQPQSYDTEKSEFLCPLCRCLSNCVVPLIPQFHLLQPPLLRSETLEDTKPPIQLNFPEWINAMFIAVKYKKRISQNDLINKSGLEKNVTDETEDSSNSSTSKNKVSTSSNVDFVRYYTCPLDQIKQEMQQGNTEDIEEILPSSAAAGENFARIYTDREGQELVFSPSVFEMMNLFSQAVYKIGLDVEPDLHDERIPMVS